MEALRRVGLGLLAAPEVRKEEDALNLALALSLSEQEQRLQDERDDYDTLLCGMSALDPIAEVCGASTTSTSATDPRPRPPRSPQAVAALPKKLRVSLKRALEEADSKDRDVEISCGAALGTTNTNDDDDTPTIELDLQDAESLSSPRMLSLGAGFDEKIQRIASAFDLSSLRSAFSPRVNTDQDESYSDDVQSQSLRRLQRRLGKFTLVEYTISGDGNCQFASLSDQLYRTPKMQGVVRRLVVQQLTDNPDYYARFVPGDYKFYCWKMSQNHVWGDHLTLQAAADRYGIQISLITSYKDAPYMHIMPREIKSCRILWLSFFGELHYNSLYTEEDIALRRRMDEKNEACVLF